MKLQVNAPETFLVERYLEEIARSYDVPWLSDILVHDEEEEEEKDDDNDDQGGGGQAEVIINNHLAIAMVTHHFLSIK
jgi:vacuolar protein sorting-associated protein IST1